MEKPDSYNAEEIIALRDKARADVNKYEQLIADFNNTEELEVTEGE